MIMQGFPPDELTRSLSLLRPRRQSVKAGRQVAQGQMVRKQPAECVPLPVRVSDTTPNEPRTIHPKLTSLDQGAATWHHAEHLQPYLTDYNEEISRIFPVKTNAIQKTTSFINMAKDKAMKIELIY